MKEWWTGEELAGLPGLPSSARAVRHRLNSDGAPRRQRTGLKGWEYHLQGLPQLAREHLEAAANASAAAQLVQQAPAQPKRRPSRVANAKRARAIASGSDLWDWAEQQDDARRAIGAERAERVRDVVALIAGGSKRDEAIDAVAALDAVNAGSLRRWYTQAMRYDRADWAAALIPAKRGRRSGNGRVEIHPEAWQWFRAQWLTRRQPTVAEVYRRLVDIAERHGWTPLPHVATFERRVAELPVHTVTYHRYGAEALANLIPRQRRDNTVYAPGEAVNGDGLKLDRLWVKWPDGEIINTTTMWPWQDLRTGRILAWRIAKTESTDLFRLATYDLTAVTLPRYAWLDNTRVAANLAMTGQAAGRHRFAGPKRAEDPLGILVQLGIEPHFTDPNKEYASPGSKRIERAFGIGGLHSEIANHPRLKDRGYSKATAIDYADLAEVAAEEITRFNARTGRRTPECNGVKSYDQLWAELTAAHTPRIAAESQRRLLLLMVEPARADAKTGEVKLKAGSSHLGAARYWADWMPSIAGQRVAVYYDPADLRAPVTVYSIDGLRLGEAERQRDAGHNDSTAAAEARRIRIRQQKAWRKMAEDDNRLDKIRAAELYADATDDDGDIPEPGQVQPRVVEAHFGGRRVCADGTLVDTGADTGELPDTDTGGASAEQDDDREARFRASVADLAARRQRAADV